MTVKDGTGAERNVTRDNIRAFNINTADSRNPIGFYKLNNTVTTIPGNKAFLVLTNAEAQAKGFVLEFEDGGTTGIQTIETQSIALRMVFTMIYRVVVLRTQLVVSIS